MNTYDVGDKVRITGAWTDPNDSDAAIDPTTVSAAYKNPSGVVLTKVYGSDADVVRSGTGSFYMDISITVSGEYWYRWIGTGTGQAAGESMFGVREQQTI